jgi:hypothetical protein
MKLKLFKREPVVLGRFRMCGMDYLEVIKYGPRHYSLKCRDSEVHYTGRKAKEEMQREMLKRVEVYRR